LREVVEFGAAEGGGEKYRSESGVAGSLSAVQKVCTQVSELAKFRAKVAAPLGDEVCFVDNKSA
jgi:hypothetical protein